MFRKKNKVRLVININFHIAIKVFFYINLFLYLIFSCVAKCFFIRRKSTVYSPQSSVYMTADFSDCRLPTFRLPTADSFDCRLPTFQTADCRLFRLPTANFSDCRLPTFQTADCQLFRLPTADFSTADCQLFRLPTADFSDCRLPTFRLPTFQTANCRLFRLPTADSFDCRLYFSSSSIFYHVRNTCYNN